METTSDTIHVFCILSIGSNSGQNGSGNYQGARKAKGRGVNAKADAPLTVAQGTFPPKFSKPLPVPGRVLIGSSDPTLKPTVAYAIVGPRIRGRFDGRKAVDLDLLPGSLRARLVEEESVTVQVKGRNDNVVDREIKPG